LRCSFCNKEQQFVRKLIAGPKVYICNECVDICNDILNDDGVFPHEGGQRCRVCGASTDAAQSLLVRGSGLVCPKCLEEMRPYFEAGQRPANYWLQHATQSLGATKLLVDEGHFFASLSHSHQCAEAALRAVLTEIGVRNLETHSVFALLQKLHKSRHLLADERTQVTSPDWISAARTLDVYYIPIQFPGGLSEFSPDVYANEQEARRAYELAEKFTSFAASVVKSQS